MAVVRSASGCEAEVAVAQRISSTQRGRFPAVVEGELDVEGLLRVFLSRQI